MILVILTVVVRVIYTTRFIVRAVLAILVSTPQKNGTRKVVYLFLHDKDIIVKVSLAVIGIL